MIKINSQIDICNLLSLVLRQIRDEATSLNTGRVIATAATAQADINPTTKMIDGTTRTAPMASRRAVHSALAVRMWEPADQLDVTVFPRYGRTQTLPSEHHLFRQR
jgi:hypothetical protein